MNIGELMKRTGASRKAIYLYESKGLIKPLKCEENGYRDYSKEDEETLILIMELRELDVPLSVISIILSNPDETDILLQAYLEKKKQELEEIRQCVVKLDKIVRHMPPNGNINDFKKSASDIMLHAREERWYKIQRDYPKEYSRRILMNTFEAFLDKPLDTLEKREKWQNVLTLNEALMNQELLEIYAEFYGGFSSQELHLDYQLRYERVHHIAQANEAQLRAAAMELVDEMLLLQKNRAYYDQWKGYADRYVSVLQKTYVLRAQNIIEIIRELSDTLCCYEQSFERIFEEFYALMSAKQANFDAAFLNVISSQLNNYTALSYYDFYRHSYFDVMTRRK